MSRKDFGIVLAAQSLYTVVQIVVDNGSAWHGARLAAGALLGESQRGSLFRLRLQLCAPSILISAGIGAIAGLDMLYAVLPFMLALILFALLNYWEDFGRGNPAPWSAYVALRAFAPALAATVCWLSSSGFPGPLAGSVECAVIVAIQLTFRLHPLHSLVLARDASRGPWREAMSIGMTSVLGQAALASGTILLVASGHAADAAVLAVGVRILTGVSSVFGVIVTALFPLLAQSYAAVSRQTRDNHEARTRLVTSIVLFVAITANSVFIIRPAFFTRLLLNSSSREAAETVGLPLAASAATGLILLLTAIHIASGTERIPLRAVGIGTVLTLCAGILVIVIPTGTPGRWMAASLLVGQFVSATLVGLATPPLMISAKVVRVAVMTAVPVSLISAAGLLEVWAEAPAAALLVSAAVATATVAVRQRRRLNDVATN